MPYINNDKHAENVSLLLILLFLRQESFCRRIYFLPSHFSVKCLCRAIFLANYFVSMTNVTMLSNSDIEKAIADSLLNI